MVDEKLSEFIRLMPKVELHLHLEGAIRPQTALDLMKRNNSHSKAQDIDDIKRLYRFGNLTEFVEGMRTVSDNLRYLEDVCRVTRELLQSLAEQNIRYVEFDCAVQKYIDLGFSLAEVIDTIQSCAKEVADKRKFQAYLVVNLLRSHGAQKAVKLVESVAKLDHPFVVGIGLSGDENKYPPEIFRDAFMLARQMNLPRTAHAGETVGAGNVWKAIRELDAHRIDHGTKAQEDETLLDYLVEHQIPLTQCLTSNLRLNVVESIQRHPFGSFHRRGMCVTLNTDDPQVFGTTLTDEYLLAANAFNLDAHQIATIVLNGVQASFIDEKAKQQLRLNVKSELDALMVKLGLKDGKAVARKISSQV